MNWLYRFTATEWTFVGLFVVFYAGYVWRVRWLARQLGSPTWRAIPKLALRTTYLTLLLIALLGPSFGRGDVAQAVGATGRDVYILLDLSRSMDASDVPPSRLELAKFALRQLTDSLAADRFGLIGFANYPDVLVPLTADHDALNRLVQETRAGLLGQGGTDVCAAIALAQQQFAQDTTRHARALLLLSDGETPVRCPNDVLRQLQRSEITVLTVGLGTTEGSLLLRNGTPLLDANGQPVRSRLNAETLRSLAVAGRGQYVEARPDRPYVADLLTALRGLRMPTATAQRVAVAADRYYYFLVGALVLLLLDVLVRVRPFRL